ncbi:MAG: sigma-70 family RNA polymerase sigma factor [Verrucomicrobiota bacterium]
MSPSADLETRFADWATTHRGIVVKIARSFAETPSDLADLEHELLLQIWLSLSSYAGQARPSTWIYRVCLNTALTWRRTTVRRERHLDRSAILAHLATDTASPAEHTGDRELLEKLYTAIHTLPDFDRALVLLSLDGVPYVEIASITGLTENHVGVALTRARQRLTARLKGVIDELE